EVLAADTVERTIDGVIVPYGEVATIAGVAYRFVAGSVKLARSRTPLLMDHDHRRPVGVLERLTETELGAVARFRLDGTPDGLTALAQAATGSRGALSIGASVEASIDNAGVLDVTAGLVHEVSLVALSAFEGATVTNVAAEADPAGGDQEEEEEPADGETAAGDELDDEKEADGETDGDEEEADGETADGDEADPADPIEEETMSAAAPPVMIAASRRAPELTAGQY